MTPGPGGYFRLVPAGLACAAIVCGGLVWLADGSSTVGGAWSDTQLVSAGAGPEAPGDGPVWTRSSAAGVNISDDDAAPTAGAAIATAPVRAVREDQAWEPVYLERSARAVNAADAPTLRGPPALHDDQGPISLDDDDDDDSDRDDAIAESIVVPDLSIRSIELVDVAAASAVCFVSARPSLRAPPAYTF